MTIAARYGVRSGEVVIPDAVVDHDGAVLRMRIEDVGNVSLTSLMHATASLRHAIDEQVTFIELHEGAPTSDPRWMRHRTPLRVGLTLFAEQLRVGVRARPGEIVPEGPGMGLFDALRATTARHRAGVSGLKGPDQFSDGQIELDMWMRPRGRTIADCRALAADARMIIDAVLRHGALNVRAASDLVRSGRADLLVGQRETQQLEVKGGIYLPWEDDDKFELAKDVSAIANGGGGALILGLKSAPDRQGDRIIDVRAVPLDSGTRRRLQDVIREWLHPIPVRVRVEIHDVPKAPNGHGIVLIEVPEQPPEHLPILIRRGQIRGRHSVHHLALAIREGEDTSMFDATRLHSLLVAGRAALGASPKPDPA